MKYLFPPREFTSNGPHTSEWTTSNTFEDLIGKESGKAFLDCLPTKQPSQMLSGVSISKANLLPNLYSLTGLGI
jgi:hypothetical protein